MFTQDVLHAVLSVAVGRTRDQVKLDLLDEFLACKAPLLGSRPSLSRLEAIAIRAAEQLI